MTQDWVYFLMVLTGMVAATVLTRSAFLLLPTRWQLPPAALAALRYAPLAAIAAIAVPDLIQWRLPSSDASTVSLATTGLLAWFNPKLLAAILAAAVHWRYANMMLTIALGMAAFWLLRYALTLGVLG